MAKKKPNKIMLWIGIIVVVIGIAVILTGTHLLPQSTVSAEFGDAKITATDIPPLDATRIIAGAVISVLGLASIGVAYKIGK